MNNLQEKSVITSESNYRFSWNKFFIKLTSAAMWAWGFACFLVTIVCIKGGEAEWIKYVVIGWVIISVFFIGGKVVVDAFAEATRKMEVKANLGLPKIG